MTFTDLIPESVREEWAREYGWREGDPPPVVEQPELLIEPSTPEPDPVAEAEHLRDEGIARADRGAEDEWKCVALDAVHAVALRLAEITADDVWDVLEANGIDGPREPRALGSIFRRAQGYGWITSARRQVQSRRPDRHRGYVSVWSSAIYREPDPLSLI